MSSGAHETHLQSLLESQLPKVSDLGGAIAYVRDGSNPGVRIHSGSGWSSIVSQSQSIVTADTYGGTTELTTIIDIIATSSKKLLIDRPMTVSATRSVPTTLSIEILPGGLLTIATGVTLTINGAFEAPPPQYCFVLTGTGLVKFGPGGVEKLYPQWWGAIPNDGLDDKTAIQAALTAAGGLHDAGGNGQGASAYVFLTSGEWNLSTALKMPPASRLVGESREGTQLKPLANINGIEIFGADWAGGFGFRNTIENLSIFYASGANTGKYLYINVAYDISVHNVFFWNTDGDGVIVTSCNQCSFHNVDIDGRSSNTTGIGLQVINSTFTMHAGIVEFFLTHIKLTKTISSTVARFFGTYLELLANQTGIIVDNVQGSVFSGLNFSNSSGGNTPIGISFINGAHHNVIIGGAFGDGSQFGFTPAIKTDAASYQNRANGTLINYFYNGNLGTPPDAGIVIDESLPVSVVTYSASMTLDIQKGKEFTITATNGTAFTINAPTNMSATGSVITVIIRNTSGGALGVATWNAVFKMPAWVQPANSFSRTVEFIYNGTNWVESHRSAADVPN